MTIQIEVLGDWLKVKELALATINKKSSNKLVTTDWKYNALISEHSMIRNFQLKIELIGIPYFVSVHFSRHKHGVEHYVSTQRTDRTGLDRSKLPQDNLVNHTMVCNIQALINMAKVRLCNQASPETREIMEHIKIALHGDLRTKEIADVLVPNCIYRCGCSEMFSNCNVFNIFNYDCCYNDLTDIRNRYKLYNEGFYSKAGLITERTMNS